VLPAWTQRWGIPTPFPVGDVNTYYLPGKVPSLVDPGPKTDAAWRALSKRLEHLRIERVYFTHYHVDHSGLASRLQQEHGVEVAAHRIDAEVLRHWGEHGAERQRDYGEGLRRAGVPDEHREHMRYGGLKIEGYADTCDVDTLLEDGDRIELGDRTFEAIHAPGHTAGSCLLRSDDASATFSGDTLLERITPNAVSVRASERGALPDYLSTLRRLQGQELGVVLPGHGALFANAPDVIRQALRHAEVRQDRIARLVAEQEGTAWNVARRLFLKLPDDQLFLAVSETLGHLEFLRREGRVRVETVDDTDVFHASGAGLTGSPA
jgi:glyoxylase-like metal-dependent hydrolase (beta-lactamase superfamily II)